jgi:hypothetical protein
MKLLQQPNRWSCLPTSFAMTIECSIEQFITHIGHDGSVEYWPELPEPLNHRSFSLEECIRAAWIGFNAMYAIFPSKQVLYPTPSSQPLIIELGREYIPYRNNVCVFLGEINGNRHAVAWDGERIFDPNGTIYSNVDSFSIDYCLIKVK